MTAAKSGALHARQPGFPKHFKSMSRREKWRWLASDEAEDRIRAGLLKKSEVEDKLGELVALRWRVVRQAPTPNLVECYDAGQPYPPPRWDPDRKSERPLVYTAEEANDEAVDFEVEQLRAELKRATSDAGRAGIRSKIENAMAMKGSKSLLSPQHEGEHLFPAYYFTTSGHYYELHLFSLYLIEKDDPVAVWVREQAAVAERSPSAEAHQELANRNAQIIEEKLDSENVSDLLSEIKSYHDGTWKPADESARSPRRKRRGDG